MVNRDSWEHSYLIVRGENLGCGKNEPAKAFAKDVFIDQERKLGIEDDQLLVVVLTINHADWRLKGH